MIPTHLIELACREFPTFDDAIASSPYGTDRIEWVEASFPNLQVHDGQPPIAISHKRKSMSLERLPSGFWAWIPNHPDDLAVVAEHKRQDNKTFGATQILNSEFTIPPHLTGNKQYLTHVEDEMKSKLGHALLGEMRQGKIYRTALIVRKGHVEVNGMLLTKVFYGLMYAEEI